MFTTISQGIAAANPGDTVQVEPGTYTEQITVNKNLTLQGAGAGQSIIQAPLPLALDALGKQVIVEVTNGATVSMSGFTVSGPGSATSGSIDYGIWVNGGAKLTVTATTVNSIRDNPATNAQTGVGILVGSMPLNQVGTAIITSDTVTDYQKGGIVVANTGSSATIQNNTVIGLGNTTVIAQNGIQVGDGATATVTGNTVSGNEYSGSAATDSLVNTNGVQAYGILLFNPNGNITVSNNTVFANDGGIYSLIPGFTATITGNMAQQNRLEGIIVDQGADTLSNNIISGGSIGVAIISFNGGTTGNSVATLAGNVIKDTVTGIILESDTGAPFSPTLTTPACNAFVNTQTAINNTLPPLVTVANDWFGSPTGPRSANNPQGKGSPVVGNISVPTISVAADCGIVVPINSPDIPLYSWVTAVYLDLVNRFPESSGLSSWVSQLKSGSSRQQVATGIWESPEHRGVEVDQFYSQYFQRNADPSGRAFWVNQLLAGLGEIVVSLDMLSSAEYNAAHPTNNDFLTALYADVLMRTPDVTGLSFWQQQLQNGTTRPEVILDFLTSPEYYTDVINMDFMRFLNRPADPSAQQFYLNGLLTRQIGIESLGVTILASEEFFQFHGA